MLEVRRMDIEIVTEAVDQILKGRIPGAIELPAGYPDNEVKQLVQHMNALFSEYRDCAEFMFAISRGDLDVEAPKSRMRLNQSSKNLQANLRHLTWKTQQIARGDFTQRMDFMGEFSTGFNSMVEQLAENRAELLRMNQELATASRTDSLTGLWNRRGCLDTILADIDRFKRINDTHGHDAGDAVLVELARILLAHVRKGDVCARWGGEEFLVLLVDTEFHDALEVVERLRIGIEAARVEHSGVSIAFTISAGVSRYDEGEDIEACIKRSDVCLYRAKEAERNQIWCQEGPDAPIRAVACVGAASIGQGIRS
jgi:diguanylate cyclase (GGDEF)-like protein